MTAIGNAPDLLSASQPLTYIPAGWGWEVNLEFGINVYTLLYIKQVTSEDLPYNTGNSLLCTNL